MPTQLEKISFRFFKPFFSFPARALSAEIGFLNHLAKMLFMANARRTYNVSELRALLQRAKTTYKPPGALQKLITETPFLGPFLMQRGGTGGKLRFVLFKAAGEIPIVGGVIETLGRRHGLVAELPTEDYRQLLKIIGSRAGGLIKPLSPVFEPARAAGPATQTVFISSDAAKLSRSSEIGRMLEGKKLKWVAGEKKIPFAGLSPEARSLLFKRRTGLLKERWRAGR